MILEHIAEAERIRSMVEVWCLKNRVSLIAIDDVYATLRNRKGQTCKCPVFVILNEC